MVTHIFTNLSHTGLHPPQSYNPPRDTSWVQQTWQWSMVNEQQTENLDNMTQRSSTIVELSFFIRNVLWSLSSSWLDDEGIMAKSQSHHPSYLTVNCCQQSWPGFWHPAGWGRGSNHSARGAHQTRKTPLLANILVFHSPKVTSSTFQSTSNTFQPTRIVHHNTITDSHMLIKVGSGIP